jgi:hypothetical protein
VVFTVTVSVPEGVTLKKPGPWLGLWLGPFSFSHPVVAGLLTAYCTVAAQLVEGLHVTVVLCASVPPGTTLNTKL